MNQSVNVKTKQATGLYLVPKPVSLVEVQEQLREGSTGRVVGSTARTVTLQRVWAVAASDVPPASAPEAKPPLELAFYRKYTEGLLRRYLRLSMQAGRVPSLLSREMFRGNVTHYRVRGFEEVIIFCHDVEQRLAKLNNTERELIKRVALQQYTQGEAAGMLGMSLSNLIQRYGQAVDRLTRMFLDAGLLNPMDR